MKRTGNLLRLLQPLRPLPRIITSKISVKNVSDSCLEQFAKCEIRIGQGALEQVCSIMLPNFRVSHWSRHWSLEPTFNFTQGFSRKCTRSRNQKSFGRVSDNVLHQRM